MNIIHLASFAAHVSYTPYVSKDYMCLPRYMQYIYTIQLASFAAHVSIMSFNNALGMAFWPSDDELHVFAGLCGFTTPP